MSILAVLRRKNTRTHKIDRKNCKRISDESDNLIALEVMRVAFKP